MGTSVLFRLSGLMVVGTAAGPVNWGLTVVLVLVVMLLKDVVPWGVEALAGACRVVFLPARDGVAVVAVLVFVFALELSGSTVVGRNAGPVIWGFIVVLDLGTHGRRVFLPGSRTEPPSGSRLEGGNRNGLIFVSSLQYSFEYFFSH